MTLPPIAAGAAAAAASAAAPAAAAAGEAAASVAPKIVEGIAAAAAPAAVAAGSKLSGTGWVGLIGGTAGIAITLIDAWKSSVGSQRGFTAGAVFNPTTVAIGGGAMLLTLGEKTLATTPFMRNGLRSAGVALVLGGLVGAIVGATRTFGNPLSPGSSTPASTQLQAPARFGTELPPAPANLEGIEVASADVIGEGRSMERVPMYVDPASAKPLPAATTLGEAIGQARAATQADDQDRSHAVIQTRDGAYWTIRLAGKLDQVDGRNYSEGTKFDDRYEPQIGRRQQAVQAIAGVEGHYVFPQGTEATAPVQYAGDIPWVVPALPGGAGTAAPSPAAPSTPATSATTPTPAASTTGS